MNIGDILNAKVGSSEKDGKLSLSFRKTINVRQYETEVIEANLEVPITTDMTGLKLEMIESVVLAKLEYGVLWNMLARGMITQAEFDDCKQKLETSVNVMSQFTGVGVEELV